MRRRYFPVSGKFTHIYHSKLSAREAPELLPEREKTILYVGHVARRKGQLVLAEAFTQIAAQFPEWKLHLAGHDAGEGVTDEIRRLAAERGLSERIVLLGQRTDSIEMMRRASIFVQPSFFEGLPLALQEAMLCGCACIATDIPGNNEIVSHENNGLLVPKGGVNETAQALSRLIRDDVLRESLQRVARSTVLEKGMSREKMVREHIAVYERDMKS